MRKMTVLAPAKINLTLSVTGRRPDGYHTVETLLQSISLCDRLTLEQTDGGFSLNDIAGVPARENIIAKADRLLRQRFPALPGIAVTLEKNIPAQAGLGGGSSDAAAYLRGVNALCGLGLTPQELRELALPLGADVPFCVTGGTALATGIGERLRPVDSRLPLHLVLLKPAVGCSTAAMYRRIDEQGDTLSRRFTAQQAAAALQSGDLVSLTESLYNIFEQVNDLPELSAAVGGLLSFHGRRGSGMVSGIIAAGGSSTRFGTGQNKTLCLLAGRPVLAYSLRIFLASTAVDEVILVARAGEEQSVRALAQSLAPQKPVAVVTGGADRVASVQKGLAAAKGEIVLIHDGARPFVTEEMIADCLAALEGADGVTTAIPSRDTVKLADEMGNVIATTCRRETFLVQTPQAFCREQLMRLHRALSDRDTVTDDCMLLERAGLRVKLVAGSERNLKITTPNDLLLAEFYLKKEPTE